MKKDKPAYTPEYRQQAVELSYARGKNVSSVARDLGISVNTLHDWRRKARLSRTEPALPADATTEERLTRLERENELLRQERDILKKRSPTALRRPPARRAAEVEDIVSIEATYQFIREHLAEYSLEVLCQVLEVSRSGYHAWRRRSPSKRAGADQELLGRIRPLFEKHRGRYGAPRISRELAGEGLRVNHKRVARLMKQHALRARHARRRVVTTDSSQTHSPCENLLEQDFSAPGPNQKWVGDITYSWTREGWLYLAVVIDLFSRQIIGWSTRDSLERGVVLRAHRMAIDRRRPAAGLISHSDRGSQYNSQEYRQLLSENGIRQSMSLRGNCYDNAVAECCFGTIKRELEEEIVQTHQAARTAIFEYIEIYFNRQRLHSTLGYKTPIAFEAAAAIPQ